ncbi:putative ribonuclease H-like domain-containing protein [Tanacetum coccineum]
MHEKFQMSSMGELTFFLGLQVQQKKDGIFISHDKYIVEKLKKFGFTEVKTASTPMETQKPLLKDEDSEEVDVHMYRLMIGSLMYLTSSRPDIMFAVCACARYQVNPKVSHLHAVKRIFRNVVWNGIGVNAGDSKLMLLGITYYCCGEGSTIPTDPYHTPTFIQPSTQPQKTQQPRKPKRKDIQVPQPSDPIKSFTDKAVHKELGDSLVRDATTASSLEAELDNGNINKTQSKATPNESGSHGTNSGGGPRRNTLRSDEDSIKLNELMALCTNLQNKQQPRKLKRNNNSHTHHYTTIIPPSTQPQKKQQPRKLKRKDTQVPQPSDPVKHIADEAIYKELGDSLVRAVTTASSLEAEQENGGGPRCQESMGDTTAQTRFESVFKHSNDSLLTRGNTLRSDEDRLKLDELMALCTTLQNRVLGLEKTKTTQHNEITSLKRRVKKLEKKNRSRTHRLKRLYKVDEEITLISVHDMNVFAGEEVVEEVVEVINTTKLIIDVARVNVVGDIVSTVNVATTTTTIITTVEDITLAQAFEEMKNTKPKKEGVVIQELGESTIIISLQLSSQQLQDKGKVILIELVKLIKKKYQIRLDKETALNLQAEFDEE